MATTLTMATKFKAAMGDIRPGVLIFSLWVGLQFAVSVTCQPSINVDWTAARVEIDGFNIDAYTIDYFPNVGKPPPPVRLSPTTLRTEISDTLAATMYTVAIIAELANGRRFIVHNATVPSSPESPLVDKVESKINEITILLFPSDSEDVTYVANYSLVSIPDEQRSEIFLQPLITLNNLNAGSEYDINIFAVYNGIYSHLPYHTTVRTRPLRSVTLGQSPSLSVSSVSLASSSSSASLATVSASALAENDFSSTIAAVYSTTSEIPSVDTPASSTVVWSLTTELHLGSTTSSTDKEYFDSTKLETTTFLSTFSRTDDDEQDWISLNRTTTPRTIQVSRQELIKQSTGGSSWKARQMQPVRKPVTVADREESPERASGVAPADRNGSGEASAEDERTIVVTTNRAQPISEEQTSNENEEEEENEESKPRVSAAANKKGRVKLVKTPKAGSMKATTSAYNFTSFLPPDIMAKLPNSYGQPRSMEFAPEGRQLRVGWKRPEETECTSYLLNYTITSLHVPKSFQSQIEAPRTYALIKMFSNNVIEIEISCLLNDTIVSKTPGRATIDLRKPEPVKNLRITGLLTDDFFRSSILLEWDWPSTNDSDAYSIVVSYFPGKAKKLKSQALIVNETGPLNISGLKATETYTFSIKNISRLNVQSAVVGLKQIMPPIISSTLLPGQVTSTSLLITYSPTDVDEARFDSYQLVACFSETVNRTLIKAKADPNRNFLMKNLIPGQTYSFYLYTVYKKVRSRPVEANFTTYPLKVKNLFAIVRRNAVKLFYEPEESPLKEIRYKLSFTGSDGSESDTATVLNQREYVFDYLKPEIWYTFAITVLMGDQESESTAQTIVTGLNSDPVPHVRGSTATTIDIAFRRDFFVESNGIVQTYSIIVAEDYRMDYFNYSVLSWRSVQNYEVWPPFRATITTYNPFKNPNDEAATYTIGIETCNVDGLDEYCNGPLKPRTEYFIKLRACTNEHICMETSYTKAATEKDTSSLETKRFLNPRYGSDATRNLMQDLTHFFLSIFLTFFTCLMLSQE